MTYASAFIRQENKVAQNEKWKNQTGFSYILNIVNFEAFCLGKNFSKKILFLRCVMRCKLYICIVAGVLQLLLLLLLFWSIWVLDWCNFWYFLSPIKQSFSWNWYIFSIWYGITFLVSCYFIVEYILVNYQIHAYLHSTYRQSNALYETSKNISKSNT